MVQKLSYSEILNRAQTAADCADWEQLSQDLQQLLTGDAQPTGRAAFSDANTSIELLSLAMQVLESGNFQQRWELAKLFPSFGIEALAPLIELLKNEDAEPEAHWFAIRILGSFNHPRVVETLIELLKSSQSEELNAMAISVLVSLGGTAVAVLEPLLQNDSTRLSGVQALGQIRCSETIPLLMKVVGDQDAQVRAIAVEALGSFHAPEITQALVTALKDPAASVRVAAVSGLGFCDAQGDERAELVTRLHPLLFDLNLEVCCQTAISLGRLATPQAAAALYEVLMSKHTPEKLAVDLVRALGWIALADALSYLEAALAASTSVSIQRETVQLEIVQALGRIELSHLKPQATAILLAACSSMQSPTIRQAIALSLSQLGEADSIDALIAMLADPDDGVRLHVISALKGLNAAAAHQKLTQLSQLESKDSEFGRGIAIALQEWSY